MSHDSEDGLNERAQRLLRVLIDNYIRDGQPVGSRTLSRDSGLQLSSATVRNVVADLEHLGFVSSPHASAGRIPTDKGYRFFVDTLLRVEPLESEAVQQLRQQLGSVHDSSRALVTSALQMLSSVTKLAGVVTLPRARQASITQIEFLGLSENRLLVILVCDGREVQNRVVQLERAYGSEELRRAANYLNEQFKGRTLAQTRDEILRQLQEAREHMNQVMLDAITMAQEVFLKDEGSAELDYVIAGQTNLMGVGALSNVERLKRLFEAFNEKRDFLSLLDHSLHAEGVQIFIGQESGYQMLEECSVVTAPYSTGSEVVGVLGVIGPTRMAYDRIIPIVDVTARLLGSALNSRR